MLRFLRALVTPFFWLIFPSKIAGNAMTTGKKRCW